MKKILFNFFEKIEHWAQILQGKGWGSFTVEKEFELASRFLKNPKVIMDVGANIGLFSNIVLKQYPDVDLHIFEPNKRNFSILGSNFSGLRNVYLSNTAVSDVAGTSSLYSPSDGSGMASLVNRKLDHFDLHGDEFIEIIDVVRLDDYMTLHNINSIDLIKIDVEGFELSVLKGLGTSLNLVKAIQFEFGGCNLDTKVSFQDFFYFFQENCFEIFRYTPFGLQKIERYKEIDEVYRTSNFLAVNKGSNCWSK